VKYRTALSAGAAIAVLLLLLAATLLWVERENGRLHEAHVSKQRAELRAALEIEKARLRRSVEALCQDAVFLAQTPPVSGIVRASANRKGIDPRDKDSYSTWEARLQEIFFAFLRVHPDRFQVRFIGAANEGRELVRVENRDGRILVAPHQALLAEGDQDFFRAGLLLTSGRVHLSGFALNREGGRIEEPHRPTLRAVTPVFDASGRLFGMVEVEEDVGALFAAPPSSGLPRGTAGYVTDQQGRYLFHPDVRRAFAFELGDKSGIADDFPVLKPLFESQAQGYRPLHATDRGSGQSIAAERVFFDPADPSRFLVLAYGTPAAEIEGHAAQIPKKIVVAILVLTIAAGVMLGLALGPMFSWFRRRAQRRAAPAAPGD
jgi:hypothetical protein